MANPAHEAPGRSPRCVASAARRPRAEGSIDRRPAGRLRPAGADPWRPASRRNGAGRGGRAATGSAPNRCRSGIARRTQRSRASFQGQVQVPSVARHAADPRQHSADTELEPVAVAELLCGDLWMQPGGARQAEEPPAAKHHLQPAVGGDQLERQARGAEPLLHATVCQLQLLASWSASGSSASCTEGQGWHGVQSGWGQSSRAAGHRGKTRAAAPPVRPARPSGPSRAAPPAPRAGEPLHRSGQPGVAGAHGALMAGGCGHARASSVSVVSMRSRAIPRRSRPESTGPRTAWRQPVRRRRA